MNSLDDETRETAVNRGLSLDEIDGTKMARVRSVDASTNTPCDYKRREPDLSPIPSPQPPQTFQELSPETLKED